MAWEDLGAKGESCSRAVVRECFARLLNVAVAASATRRVDAVGVLTLTSGEEAPRIARSGDNAVRQMVKVHRKHHFCGGLCETAAHGGCRNKSLTSLITAD